MLFLWLFSWFSWFSRFLDMTIKFDDTRERRRVGWSSNENCTNCGSFKRQRPFLQCLYLSIFSKFLSPPPTPNPPPPRFQCLCMFVCLGLSPTWKIFTHMETSLKINSNFILHSQNLQPFTGNGDVSIWVKNSRVGRKTRNKNKKNSNS